MGVIRGGALVIVSVLLFVVFLAGNVLWTLDKSLDYDTLKPELASVVKEIISDQMNVSEVVEEEFGTMESYCLNNSEYVFSEEESDRVFVLPCDVVAQGSDAVVEHAIGDLAEEVYAGQTEGAEFDFVSMKNSVNSYFYIALIVALVLAVLVFFLAEVKSNSFIIAGSLLIISSLPFAKIEKFFSLIPFDLAEHFAVFFSQAYSVFLTSLITGLVVLAVGIVMKFFGIGFKMFGFMNKLKSKGQDSKKQVASKQSSGTKTKDGKNQ